MDDLKARYPWLFAGKSIGHDFPLGWRAILERLYAAFDEELTPSEKSRVSILQQKEKLGGLRVYLAIRPQGRRKTSSARPTSRGGRLAEHEDDHIYRRLGPFIRAAERESMRTCILCGAPGELRYDNPWILPLCDDHREADDA